MLRRVVRLKALLLHAQEKLLKIQAECPHPQETLYKELKSDTGNWDRSDDSYWAVYDCGDCGRKWVGDQQERKGKGEK